MRKVKMTSADAHACMNADVRSLFYLANSQLARAESLCDGKARSAVGRASFSH